jgi:hypothetical protein
MRAELAAWFAEVCLYTHQAALLPVCNRCIDNLQELHGIRAHILLPARLLLLAYVTATFAGTI